MRTVLALITLSTLLVACGNKGALYLPPEEPRAQQAAPEPAPEDKDKKPSQ